MVPSAVVSLPALPLTPSGKIDRKALPAPEYARSADSGYVPARTPLEEKLVSIWSEALKLPQIGIHDDFFELGGHSLLAVELFNRIEREMGETLPLNLLFRAPTVAQLVSHMGVKEWQSVETSIRPCRTGGSRPPLFAAHGIGGTVLTFRALAKHLDPDQPVYCLEALDINLGWTSLEGLASHYVRDILAFQPEGPYHLIGSSFGGMVVFEIARQLRAQGLEVGLVGLLDSYNMGARNLLSNRERFERQATFLYKRVLMHLKRFPDRSLSQWPRYAVGRMLAVGRRLHGALWRIAYKSYNTAPANKPPILRNIKRTFELAGMSYFPQACPGKVVLFRRGEQISEQQIQRQHGWTGLALGGLEIIEVPGDHNSLMSEPHVKVLAQELTNWLDRYSTCAVTHQPESTEDPASSNTLPESDYARSLR
jgi:thioesterase domain-containing protein/acyl carrier protein